MHFQVLRFWDVIDCVPPCCPQTYLVETPQHEFLYLQSWTVLPPEDDMRRDCTARTEKRRLVAFETAGEPVDIEKLPVKELLLMLGAGECQWVPREKLPPEFRSAVGIH